MAPRGLERLGLAASFYSLDAAVRVVPPVQELASLLGRQLTELADRLGLIDLGRNRLLRLAESSRFDLFDRSQPVAGTWV